MAATFHPPIPTGKGPRHKSLPSFSRQNSWTKSPGFQSASTNHSPTNKHKEIPIWLSVFFGDLNLAEPQLDHARFDAKIIEDVFDRCQPSHGPTKSSHAKSDMDLDEKQRLSEDLASIAAIKRLSASFNDLILSCVKKGCAICKKQNPQSVVYHPLSATRYGYIGSSDMVTTGRLMTIIASHTTHITELAEIDWSIGNFTSNKPYICTLGVPVCTANGKCSRAAVVKIQAYLDAILEGRLKPNAAAARSCAFKSTRGQSDSSKDVSPDYFGNWSFRDTSVATSSSGTCRLYTVGTTVFIGRPPLEVDDSQKRGQLGCLVYSSKWPKELLQGSFKNEADDAVDYCRVAARHEQLILESAEWRCAVCVEPVKAASLVHRPLAFKRTSARVDLNGSIRQLVMRLFQYVNGRYKFGDVNWALGSASDAHIFDYVVPICKTKTICEQVARLAALDFVTQLAPLGMHIIFPGLEPDTDLKVFEGTFYDDSVRELETPQLQVSKPASCGFMTDESIRMEDPSVSSLRDRLHQQARRSTWRKMERKRSGYDSDSDSEDFEVEESSVWVYGKHYIENGTPVHSSELDRPPEPVSKRIERLERRMLFQPMLGAEFWMVLEATRRSRINAANLSVLEEVNEEGEEKHTETEDDEEDSSSTGSADTQSSTKTQVFRGS